MLRLPFADGDEPAFRLYRSCPDAWWTQLVLLDIQPHTRKIGHSIGMVVACGPAFCRAAFMIRSRLIDLSVPAP